MCNEDGQLQIVFNGEIYNFRELRTALELAGHSFRTQSDTEVIVHAYEEWGCECLQHLRGMFAFAIWDGHREEMFVARDRVGIKPLQYALTSTQFAVASEIQALTGLEEVDRSIDLASLDAYLHLQYIPAPLSIYRGIRKLPPAHWMRVGMDGGVDGPHRYWDIGFDPDETLSEEAWIERFTEGLRDAVRSHLVADVPFGAFLSGGIDSSSVVAFMGEAMERPVEAFTIGFEGWPEGDEREAACVAASAVGARHHVQVVSSEGLALLPALARYHGEPFGDSSAICTYAVARVARREVKMVLSGDGGDEVLGGYPYFPKLVAAFERSRNRLQVLRGHVGQVLRQVGLRQSAPTLAETWYDRSPCFGETWRSQLWRPEFRRLMSGTRRWNEEQFRNASGDVLSRCQNVDIHNYLVYDNLCKVDVATMANGLEVRVPLLDHKLVEMVARTPSRLRLRWEAQADGGSVPRGKYMLRKVSERYFPAGFHDRPKKGFSVPVSDWFAGPACGHLRDRLEDERAGLTDWFDMTCIRQLCEEHRSGVADHGHRLYALLFLAEWRAGARG